MGKSPDWTSRLWNGYLSSRPSRVQDEVKPGSQLLFRWPTDILKKKKGTCFCVVQQLPYWSTILREHCTLMSIRPSGCFFFLSLSIITWSFQSYSYVLLKWYAWGDKSLTYRTGNWKWPARLRPRISFTRVVPQMPPPHEYFLSGILPDNREIFEEIYDSSFLVLITVSLHLLLAQTMCLPLISWFLCPLRKDPQV